jgi:hypothetical protein
MSDAVEESTCPNCSETIGEELEACPACGYLMVDANCDQHTHREAEGSCVICGAALCAECNRPQGRHFVCEQHAEIPLMSGWAQVYSALDDVDGELMRENLEAEGIEARLLSQKDHSFSVEVGELSQVRVLVPAFEYEDALEVIEEHTSAEGAVSFACPGCGEAYEPGGVTCSSCGATLPSTIPGSRA